MQQLTMEDWLDQDLWSGKTSSEPSPQTEEKTSKPSSRKSSKSQNQTHLMCLCLRKINGHTPESSTMRWEDGQLRGDLSMLNFGESPSAGKESLWLLTSHRGGAADILFEQYLGNESEPEIQPQPEGMPGNTEQSTEAREDTSTATGSSPSETIGGGTISFQERAGKPGGGKGILIQNERVGTLSTLNNQSVFTLNGKDVTPPLDAHYGLGAGARSGVEREAVMIYGISSLDSNAMKSPNPKSGIYEDQSIMTFEVDAGKCDMRNRIHMGNVSPTLVSNSGNALFCLEGNGQRESHKGDGYKESETMYTLNTVEQHGVCYSQDRFDKYTENDKSPSLLSSGGMYGGERDTCYIKKQ